MAMIETESAVMPGARDVRAPPVHGPPCPAEMKHFLRNRIRAPPARLFASEITVLLPPPSDSAALSRSFIASSQRGFR